MWSFEISSLTLIMNVKYSWLYRLYNVYRQATHTHRPHLKTCLMTPSKSIGPIARTPSLRPLAPGGGPARRDGLALRPTPGATEPNTGSHRVTDRTDRLPAPVALVTGGSRFETPFPTFEARVNVGLCGVERSCPAFWIFPS